MNWTLISAVNNEEVLSSCLLASPDIPLAADVFLQKGASSAAVAYNSAIRMAKTDILVFSHQDIYLPQSWIAALEKAVDQLSLTDPNWGVLGVWGGTKEGIPGGFLYWTGRGVAGTPFDHPVEVATLDEVVLVIRKSSGLEFDESLPGFHMYGADLCQQALHRGLKCYAINAFCIHNTSVYRMLPLDFWRCYLFMRKKWRADLPLLTPCTKITFWCWPMIRWNISRMASLAGGETARIATRVKDPGRLYHQMVCDGTAPALSRHE